ncbi:MAG: DUF1992 domain-containing protein [Microbacterium sp.]|uniref:DnaJ family domain-containing protein n=1 Tax=Microbacterium sp. TaxID=51671 RepID=UPI003F81DD9B
MSEDPRLAAARYRAAHGGEDADGEADAADPGSRTAKAYSAADRAAVVETAIQQAIRRGEFDDLPGAGKPLPDLGDHHDPDWWIRRKIETEQLTGLGPPALMLRVESDALEASLDQLTRESEVRDALEDFNRRVVEARRQLLGGPPVVTATRDIEVEVAAWAQRRESRAAAEATAKAVDAAAQRRRRWWRRPDA